MSVYRSSVSSRQNFHAEFSFGIGMFDARFYCQTIIGASFLISTTITDLGPLQGPTTIQVSESVCQVLRIDDVACLSPKRQIQKFEWDGMESIIEWGDHI